MAQYEKLINLSLLNQFLTKAKTIFAPKITASGILKGDGAGNVSAATAGTDYATPAQSLTLGLTGASVGDLVRVNAVDSSGKPTSWKHVPLNEIKCNKNLLDNWYFVGGGSQLGDGVFPINQRGQTTYNGGSVYGIDRWYNFQGAVTTNIASNGISISRSTGVYFSLIQKISNVHAIRGKVVTFSMIKNSAFARARFNIDNTYILVPDMIACSVTDNLSYSVVKIPIDADEVMVAIETSVDSAVVIAAVKLELGSEQTLCHNEGTEQNPVWVLNEVPDYGEELAKCQRYFVRYSSNSGISKPLHFICINENYVDGDIYLPEKMASFPCFTLNGVTVQRPNANLLSVPNVTNNKSASLYNNAYYMYINAPGVSIGDIGYLRLSNNSSYIDISCEP